MNSLLKPCQRPNSNRVMTLESNPCPFWTKLPKMRTIQVLTPCTTTNSRSFSKETSPLPLMSLFHKTMRNALDLIALALRKKHFYFTKGCIAFREATFPTFQRSLLRNLLLVRSGIRSGPLPFQQMAHPKIFYRLERIALVWKPRYWHLMASIYHIVTNSVVKTMPMPSKQFRLITNLKCYSLMS